MICSGGEIDGGDVLWNNRGCTYTVHVHLGRSNGDSFISDNGVLFAVMPTDHGEDEAHRGGV